MAEASRDDNHITSLIAGSNAGVKTTVVLLADATTSRLLVDALSEVAGHGAITTVRVTSSTPATAVQFASASCKRVVVQALIDNTNAISVGDSATLAAEANHRGILLHPSQTMEFFVNDANLLYFDVQTTTEGITYFYEN